jgi:glucuronokinase
MIIHTEAHARAGLLGNPSDMYGGRVISFLLRDFVARVTLWESPSLIVKLHPEHDRAEFSDLADLVGSVERHGYYGMQRVVFAACKRFVDYAGQRSIRLMIIATLRALLKFYRIPARKVPARKLAELALSVETEELGIAAGLQDRVVQSYGGLTYMDFSGGKGEYTRLSSRSLPRFGLAYLAEDHFGTLESGRVHSEVRYRWERGDTVVRKSIKEIARCALLGRRALTAGDHRKLGRLMDRNFDLRRGLFGDEALGAHNVRLVEIAREQGFAAKLPGSSGAALILLGEGEAEEALVEAYGQEGYRYQAIEAF